MVLVISGTKKKRDDSEDESVSGTSDDFTPATPPVKRSIESSRFLVLLCTYKNRTNFVLIDNRH